MNVSNKQLGKQSLFSKHEVILNCPNYIQEKIKEKRKIKKLWQTTKCYKIKKKLNYVTKLKVLLKKDAKDANESVLYLLQGA